MSEIPEGERDPTKQDKKGRWLPGVSGNPKGKPKGAKSILTYIRRKFKEDPEYFQEWVNTYMDNPNNYKHVVEMLEGKPYARGEMKVDLPNTLIELIHGTSNPEPSEELPEEDTD